MHLQTCESRERLAETWFALYEIYCVYSELVGSHFVCEQLMDVVSVGGVG